MAANCRARHHIRQPGIKAIDRKGPAPAMIEHVQRLQPSRALWLYVTALCLARGVLLPDFRYANYSIVLIQLVFPVLLVLPMYLAPRAARSWLYGSGCLAGIILAAGLAYFIYFLDAGIANATDPVSVAISMQSLLAQLLLFCVAAVGALLIARVRR